MILGIDEVGRGALAGPFVAGACLVATTQRYISGVTDSKVLTAARRASLDGLLSMHPEVKTQTVFLDVPSINSMGIQGVTVEAFLRLIQWAKTQTCSPLEVYIDGNPLRALDQAAQTIPGVTLKYLHKADALIWAVSAASIRAKVARDRYMTTLGASFPSYGWGVNSGYGTPQHLEALRRDGPTPHHRLKFIRGLLEDTALPAKGTH